MTIAYIGVGSNVGDRSDFVRRAMDELDAADGIAVRSRSSLYETSPVGGPPQRSFINAVAAIETSLAPRDLLSACKEVEARLGREPTEMRWGPRVIDLDILLYGEEKVGEEDLEIPHPRLADRRFMLVPLLEIDPEARDPWGVRYADLVGDAQGDVERIEPR